MEDNGEGSAINSVAVKKKLVIGKLLLFCLLDEQETIVDKNKMFNTIILFFFINDSFHQYGNELVFPHLLHKTIPLDSF